MTIFQHKHVTTEWTEYGHRGRGDCVCCGLTVPGESRVLTVRHTSSDRKAILCDDCVYAIAEATGRPAPNYDAINLV
jgi:hypothetical protein